MIKYTARAARAIAFLKRAYNDVDIFVEDTGNHNMWLFLLEKLLPDGVRLTSINLLGGRDRVIAACRLDQVQELRPKLYIIDADFGILLGKHKPKLKYLYRLRAYCVENMLIREGALVKFGMMSKPKASQQDVEASIQFDVWIKEVCDRLGPLFQLYAAATELDRSIETVGRSVTTLFEQTSGGVELSARKVGRRMREVARAIVRSTALLALKESFRRIRQRVEAIGADKWISGKHYIFPLLRIMLRRTVSFVSDS